MADQEVQVPNIIPNQQPEVQNQPPVMQIDENRVPIGAEARNAMPRRPSLHEMFLDLNQQRHLIPVGEPIEPGFERPIEGPILHAGQRNGFPRQPPPYWAPIEQQGEAPWQGREFQRQPEPYYYPVAIPPPNGIVVQFREPMEPPWMQGVVKIFGMTREEEEGVMEDQWTKLQCITGNIMDRIKPISLGSKGGKLECPDL
jgi:hypothetical protein